MPHVLIWGPKNGGKGRGGMKAGYMVVVLFTSLFTVIIDHVLIYALFPRLTPSKSIDVIR